MSEVQDGNTAAGETQVGSPPAGEPQKQPKILKVYDREFDISTSEGFTQAQTWAEAMSTFVGKQSNEVGALRKFKRENELPAGANDFLAKVTELREMGDHRRADEMILQHAANQEAKSKERLQIERDNDRLWEEYFSNRQDLLRYFPKETIRAVSESRLGIYDRDDPFAYLDNYWKPKFSAPSLPGELVPPKKPASPEVPPVTLSGGTARPTPPPAKVDEPPVEQELDKILRGHSIYK